jgi:toxin-antitoxin system PIN domain toxin
MRRSSNSFLFPDVNVWLAFSYERHIHYPIARAWIERLDDDSRLCLCRFTQISLLRLLTTEAVMGRDVLSQAGAWQVYDRWLEDDRMVFINEPPLMEASFRALSQQTRSSPKDWADAYLAAFATVAGLRLVTFDQAFRGKSADLLILDASVTENNS